MEFKSIIEPSNDIRPHIDSLHCYCKPFVVDGDTLVHNAFDGRYITEIYDEAMGTADSYPSVSDCVELGELILRGEGSEVFRIADIDLGDPKQDEDAYCCGLLAIETLDGTEKFRVDFTITPL